MSGTSRSIARSTGVAGLALTAFIAATAACDGDAASPTQPQHATTQNLAEPQRIQGDSAPPDNTATVDDQDLSIPLTIGELVPPSPAASEVIWLAAEKLTQECMAERGFEYDPLPSPAYARSWLDFRASQLMTAERAQTLGYHPVPYSMPPELAAAYVELEERTNSDPAYRAAYSAQPGEAAQLGCSVLASEQLNFEAELMSREFQAIMSNAEAEVFEAINADPTYSAAVAAWSACMSDGGYDYATPDDAFADERWFTEPGAPTELERATALHDASCRDAVGLNDAARNAQQRAVARWIERNHATVQALRSAESELLAAAQRLLGE